jgi:hypothetical protein
MSTVTLDLPEKTMEQARQAADALQKPVEDVLTDMLVAVLPPIGDTPADVQAELTRMTWLDNRTLWQIARRMMTPEEEANMADLSHRQQEVGLSQVEQKQLDALRREYGRITLMKARAYALLSLRGGKPLLSQV